MIGEVFGNYHVIAKLGEGGMGAVYLAEHPSIGRKVAVKMIRPAFSNDAETLRRFVREARSTATLRHPALVDVMDYGVHEKTGSAYIIMEYLEGESLDARLERQGALPPRAAAEIARQIALGMAAAHRAGIIHRDLKPGNVHLVADPDRPGVDIVKVLDFGIAKLANNDTGAGPTTRSDVLLGTPRYMAPEQCRGGGAFDHRVDIYSLGCLLYEALSGRPPFVYQWPGELIAAHLAEMPAPLRAFAPAVPEGLESIVMRAIAKHPDHRQSTMSDIARELDQFLAFEAARAYAANVSVAPMAIGGSVAPGPDHAGAPLPNRASPGEAATTTASVVMRHRQGAPGEPPAMARAHDAALAQPHHPRVDAPPRRNVATASPLVRRTLIGVAAVAAAAGLIFAAARPHAKSPRPQVLSADVAPAATTTTASPPALLPTPSAALAAVPSSETPEVATALPSEATAGADDESTDHAKSNGAAPSSSASPSAGLRASTAAQAGATEAQGSVVRIKVANPRPGLRVMVDGRPTTLPVRLPRDQKSHVLAFTAPNFKLETKTVVADQDQTLSLEYRPKLYVP